MQALEADVAAHWDRKTFAAYAAALQRVGDLRGEWIDLELAMLRNGLDPAMQRRRDELVAPYHPHTFTGSRFRYGFIDDFVVHTGLLSNRKRLMELVAQLLDSSLAAFVRQVSIFGGAALVTECVARLAARPRPWLHTLRLHVSGSVRPPISADLAQQLVDGSPRLGSIQAVDARATTLFGCVARPGLEVTDVEQLVVPRDTTLRISIAGHAPEELELSRLQRLHAGTLEQLSDPTRDAWADLRWAIDRAAGDWRARAPRPFPVASLARIVQEIDFSSYYGADWIGLDGKLSGDTALISTIERGAP